MTNDHIDLELIVTETGFTMRIKRSQADRATAAKLTEAFVRAIEFLNTGDEDAELQRSCH